MQTDASGYLKNWWDNHSGDSNFAADFGSDVGLSQSFVCNFADPCERPSCKALSDSDSAQSGPQWQILVALSNISKYLHSFKESLESSRDRWSSLQVSIQQNYWPNPPSNNMMTKQMLNALNTIIACVAASASGPAGGIATSLSAGIAGGITLALDDKDASLEYLASIEKAADSWIENGLTFLNKMHDGLMSVGHYQSEDAVLAAATAVMAGLGVGSAASALITPSTIDIQPLLQGGVWADYTNIPVINTDASKPKILTQELNEFVSNPERALVLCHWPGS